MKDSPSFVLVVHHHHYPNHNQNHPKHSLKRKLSNIPIDEKSLLTATFDCIGSKELKFDAVVDDGSSPELFVVDDFFCDSNNWLVIC